MYHSSRLALQLLVVGVAVGIALLNNSIATAVAPPLSTIASESQGDTYQLFLPQILRDSCPPFLEDFSTTENGWLEGGIFVQEYGYANADEEYFLRLLAPGFTAGVPMPLPCTSESIDASVTGRWLDDAGAGFGIQFGPTLSPTLYYLFEANPDSQTYRVLERTPTGVTTFIPDTFTDALTPGEPATLRIRIANEVATLYVNETPLEEFIYLYEGNIQLGFTISALTEQPTLPLEARFDDVRVFIP
jgi:hypothetical protein